MRKSLLAIIAASMISGCKVSPTDPIDQDLPKERSPYYNYYIAADGYKMIDGQLRYYLMGVITNNDTTNIRINAVYDSLYRSENSKIILPGFQSDSGIVGKLKGSSIQEGLIHDPNIPVKTSDTTGYRIFWIEGSAEAWKPNDTIYATIFIKTGNVPLLRKSSGQQIKLESISRSME